MRDADRHGHADAPAGACTVLHIGKFYPPHRGGMETYLRELLTALEARGIRCLALVHRSPADTSAESEGATANGPRIERVAVWAQLLFAPISPGFPWQLNRLLRLESPDVLHLHLPNVSAFWALLLPRARRAPWVVHWHADVPVAALHRGLRWFYRLYRPFEQRLLRQAAVIIVTSPPYLESSPTLAPFHARCQVVPVGIREPLAPAAAPATAPVLAAPIVDAQPTPAREPDLPLRVIAVGRLAYYKGFEVLIRAVARCPDVNLEIVGDGDRRAELSALVAQLQLAGRVTLLGELSDRDLDQRLRASDCLCLPSIERTEAFGVVLLEAMARGKACVVTAVPGAGMSWVAQHGTSGLVVPPGDVDALAQALQRLAADRVLCEALGAAGLARFREAFSIDVSAAAIERIYLQLGSSA